MVYKKYIKKNGKFYGPYIYHSRRVNGKVISEYRGIDKKPTNSKKFIFIIFGVILLITLVYVLTSFKGRLSGSVVLNIEANYQNEKPLDGILKLSLKEGELIPASSKIVFEISNEKYEYNLKEFISEEAVEGDFYINGKSISGRGLGYGISGKKVTYLPVFFTLRIYSPESSEEQSEEGSSEQTEEVEKTGETEEIQTETNESEILTEQNIQEEQINISGEIQETEETQTETNESGTQIEEQNVQEEQINISGEIQETEEEFQEEVASSEITGTEETSSQQEEPVSQESESPEVSITGNVISNLFGNVFNFFRALTPTGRVSMEIGTETEIQGEVSADKPFIYNLEEGQIAEIVSSSQNVNLAIENNVATITTNYFEEESGFGKDYLGDNEKLIIINLSDLNLTFEKGELKIGLLYADEEIVSSSILLEEEEVIKKEILNESLEIESIISLNEEEREILIREFGNLSIKRTARLFNDRIIVRHELGDNWIENSYDTGEEQELELLMERDRIKWLKDIAQELLQEESKIESMEEFESNYSI